MALLITNYAFNKATKTVTFRDYSKILKEAIDKITNTTAGIIIYDEYDDSKKGTVVDNKIVLDYDTSAMNDTDVLEIFYTPIYPNMATQDEIDSGDIKDKCISPRNFTNSSQLKTIKDSIENFEIELTRKSTGDSFIDITKVGSLVTQIDYWSDAAKTIKIFTRNIVYSSEYPTSIVTKDEITGTVETQTITWSGDVPSDINIVIS